MAKISRYWKYATWKSPPPNLKPMPLRNDLLNPIPGENPAGENLRYAPVYDKIKEARREDDDLAQGEWARERKVSDWPLVIKLAGDALATKSKDLQLAAWLAEAALRKEGVGGLRDVLDLMRGLIENFWDGLYPELEDGDAELRATPLQWVGDRLEQPVKRVPLTKKGLDWYKYKESRTIGTEEAASQSDQKREARAQAIADGKVPQEEFDRQFEETPKKFYGALLEAFDGSMESLTALSDLCGQKFGDIAPSFGTLQRTLEEVRQTVYILLQAKREKEPDEAVAPPPAEPEAEEEVEPAAGPVSAAAAAPAGAPVRKGSLAAEPVDRDDAIARVVSAAKFLRQQDPYTPSPYLLLRGLRWGELRAAGDTIDQTMLTAPATEIRQNLKRLSIESNWTEVLEAGETAMGMECGRGWLDLQRYIARACYELGSYYAPIRSAIISTLRALLADYPQLAEMTLMDDTPVANAETQAWLKDQVAAAAAVEVEAPAPAPSWDAQAPEPGVPLPPDPFELAMQAARAGRPQEGIELLMRELSQERSGRARFLRKAQLAQLCVSTGHEGIAHPILQELANEVERRKLEDWEAPDMVAHPLALLYRCLPRDGSPDERQKLYSWICRLDPLQALNVAR
jgi:type VI secretion system protein ImpA